MISEGMYPSEGYSDGEDLNQHKGLLIIKQDIFVNYKHFMKHLSEGGTGIVYWTQPDTCNWCIKLNQEVLSTDYWQNWCHLNGFKVLILKPDSRDPDGIKDKISADGNKPLEGTPDLRLIRMTGTSGITQIAQGGYISGGPEHWINTFDYNQRTRRNR